MTRRRRIGLSVLFVVLVAVALFFIPRYDTEVPLYVYLTWQGDVSRTMTVNFQTKGPRRESVVYYDAQPRGGDLAGYAHTAVGTSKKIRGVANGRYAHAVELKGLLPGTTYYFSVGGSEVEPAREYKFRTCPDDDSPLRFICGGDMGNAPRARVLMERGVSFDPLFAIIGGDLAYANGLPSNVAKWDVWLQNYTDVMVRSDGCLIPLVVAIGNHDTSRRDGSPEERAPFYFGFFAQGGASYFSRTFGENLVLVVLDTGHIHAHGGAQKEWLAKTLADDKETPFTMAAYHVPLYPSRRDFDMRRAVEGRKHWLPLFDLHGLDVAFEHHDHTHKRTKPLRGNAVDPDGTLYLGDGAFGSGPSSVRDPDAWYLAASSSTLHFWVANVTADGFDIFAVNESGEVFDAIP